jgi:hypothetical protein
MNLHNFTDEAVNDISARIYLNECGGRPEFLVHWNMGENFMSLGLGHFIWYPPQESGIFTETFPLLLGFLKQNGVKLPDWLTDCGAAGAPWPDRDTFLGKKDGQLASELRQLMLDTFPFQAEFIVKRAINSLQENFSDLPEKLRFMAMLKIDFMLECPKALYPLIDYINFKGDGTARRERYNGYGWGLLQVLEAMPHVAELSADNVCQAFADAAKQVLSRRVDNSPAERNEMRWIPGWFNRIDSYV